MLYCKNVIFKKKSCWTILTFNPRFAIGHRSLENNVIASPEHIFPKKILHHHDEKEKAGTTAELSERPRMNCVGSSPYG